MLPIIAPYHATPVPELSVRFLFPGDVTLSAAFPDGFYEHDLLFLQTPDYDDVLIKFSTTPDEDADDDDFLVPSGTTVIIGRPPGTSGMYIHAKNLSGLKTGELVVHAGDLRMCNPVQYDVKSFADIGTGI